MTSMFLVVLLGPAAAKGTEKENQRLEAGIVHQLPKKRTYDPRADEKNVRGWVRDEDNFVTKEELKPFREMEF